MAQVGTSQEGDLEGAFDDALSDSRNAIRDGSAASGQADRPSNLRRKLVSLDAVAVLGSWGGAAVAPVLLAPAVTVEDKALTVGAALLVTAVTVLAIAAHRLYRARVCAVRAIETTKLARAAFVGLVAMVAADRALGLPIALPAILAGTGASFVLLLLGRSRYRRWLSNRRRHGSSVWPVLLVGGNEDAAMLWRLADEYPEYGFRIRGLVADEAAVHPDLRGVRWLGEPSDIERALEDSGAAGVLIAARALPSDIFNQVVRRLAHSGYHVQIFDGLQGIAHSRLRVSQLAHEPLYYLENAGFTPLQLAYKRALDVVGAAIGLVLLAPAIAMIALAVRVSDGGPALFRQRRVGQNHEPFTMLKFRTMVVDAEERLAELRDANARTGPLFKMPADPRVTRVGHLLRATSLDELPQLVNVLRGEMSLVGPRPALPHEAAQFGEQLRSRARVRPGITGLWQLEARDKPSFWAYERLDLFYVENWSVGLDLSILLGTAVTVARRGLVPVKESLRRRERSVAPGLLD